MNVSEASKVLKREKNISLRKVIMLDEIDY